MANQTRHEPTPTPEQLKLAVGILSTWGGSAYLSEVIATALADEAARARTEALEEAAVAALHCRDLGSATCSGAAQRIRALKDTPRGTP